MILTKENFSALIERRIDLTHRYEAFQKKNRAGNVIDRQELVDGISLLDELIEVEEQLALN